MSFIPGMHPGLVLSAGFQFIGAAHSTDNTSETIDISSIPFRAGDIAVYFEYCRQSGGPTPAAATPSGFSNKINSSASWRRAMVSTKILVGSESILTGMSMSLGGDTFSFKTVVVFRLPEPVSTITANDTAGEVTSNDPSSQTINASSTGSYPVLVVGQMANSFVAIDPRTVSPTMNEVENSTSGAYQFIHWQYYKEGASNHTYDMDNESESENCLQSCYLTFS